MFFSLVFVFVANAQVIVLQKPTKGDVWSAFSIQRIQWASTNIDNIKIESSLDSGRTWTTIVSSYPASAEFYDWEVPNKVSDSCYIRVSDVLNASNSSTNFRTNPFKIPSPSLRLDSLSTSVFGGTVLPISWSFSGVRKINLYVSYGGKTNFRKIVDTLSANTGYYNWVTKDTVSTNCYIKIEDATNSAMTDTIKSPFSINALPRASSTKFRGGAFDGHTSRSNAQKQLVVTSPNLKDSLVGALVYTVRWKSNNIDQLRIEYTINNGSSWNIVANSVAASAGQYDWVVPNSPTMSGRIRLVDLSDTSFFDLSDSLFTIRKKELKITYPTKEDKLVSGTVWPISWNSLGVTRVRLFRISPNALIVDSLMANTETYNWVAANQPDSFRIIIRDLSDSTLSDTTDFLKSIRLPSADSRKYRGGSFDGHSFLSNQKSTIQIISPNNRLSYPAGSEINIQWKSVNIERLNILLSTDSLKTWNSQGTSVPSSAGTYKLKLPNISAGNCFLKLVSTTDSLVFDITDSAFSLLPKRIVNTTDSIGWQVGLTKVITWESFGIDSIHILYKTANNGQWNVLNRSYPANAEVFNWVIPAAFDSLWLRIADALDTSLVSTTTYHKKIQQSRLAVGDPAKFRGGKFDGHSFRSNVNKIIIKRPDANEVIISGSTYTINWATINLTDSVLLQYSIDSGKTWVTIGRALSANGSYVWNIPLTGVRFDGGVATNSTETNSAAINSEKCLIRALDQSNNNEIVGISSKTFIIKAKEARLANRIDFTRPRDMVWPDSSKQKLIAKATSGKSVKFFLAKGTAAQISADTLTAIKAGNITIAAFEPGDSNYLNSDTVLYSICINPSKPTISVKDNKTRFCIGDSTVIQAPDNYTNYKWSRGDTLRSIVVRTSQNLSVQVGAEGCLSKNSDTVRLTMDIMKKPSVSIINAAILRSSSANKYQWYRNDNKVDSATRQEFVPPISGRYKVQVFNDIGCTNISDSIGFIPTAIVPINPADPSNVLKVSPNPVRAQQVTIQYRLSNKSVVEILLLDQLGRVVFSEIKTRNPGVYNDVMRLPKLSSGTYKLVLRTNTNSSSKGLIIENLQK